MPRSPPVIYIYPLSNYEIGMKAPLLEKDSSVKQRMERMESLYKEFGLRRVVEGLLVLHYKGHPHVLVLQIGNTFFKLPGGRLRINEQEVEGLQRKLTNKLGTPNKDFSMKWRIGELVSTWWRPNFESVMYPYVPPQCDKPKESRKLFLVSLPPRGIFAVPKNYKFLAVPLFDLYDNAHRYGTVIASIPQLVSRVNFVCCDENGLPLQNDHISALSLNNQIVYQTMQAKMKEMKEMKEQKSNENNNNNNNTNANPHTNTNANTNVNSNTNTNMSTNMNANTNNATMQSINSNLISNMLPQVSAQGRIMPPQLASQMKSQMTLPMPGLPGMPRAHGQK